MNGAIKLLSWIFKMLRISEILENNQQNMLFSKKLLGLFFNFQKRNICERTRPGVYKYKISCRYLENDRVLAF